MTNTDSAAERTIPAIKPKMQTGQYWQAEGQAWREAFVVLPDGLVAQDLTDYPQEVWVLIQQSLNLALRRFDKVFCVSADGTWALEARVGFADTSRVALTKLVDDEPGLGDALPWETLPENVRGAIRNALADLGHIRDGRVVDKIYGRLTIPETIALDNWLCDLPEHLLETDDE